MKNEQNTINTLFEKSFKEIESKMKELFISEIKIKENIKSIEYYKNKNINLENTIKEKQNELHILKQLLILKEKKKLNFDYIIQKYLSQLLISKNKVNNIEQEEINKNKINSLLEGFNNEFNYYLNIGRKSKKKLHRYNSDLFNKELIKKNNEDFKYAKNNIKNLKMNTGNNQGNISAKNNYNKINYEGNKNLKKSRENLEYLFLQNAKEKNERKDYISFVKLIFFKINNYKNNNNKNIFYQLINIYKINKLKDLLNYINIKKLIFLRIKIIMIKSSEIYNESNNEEILDDNEFIDNINPIIYNEEENKNKINEYIISLDKMKDINNSIKEINLEINDFIDKIE